MNNTELSNKRIEDAKKNIAKIISSLETTTQEIIWACSDMNWNDDVVFLIKDASLNLGYALAALCQWHECLEDSGEHNNNSDRLR